MRRAAWVATYVASLLCGALLGLSVSSRWGLFAGFGWALMSGASMYLSVREEGI